ncbi:N-acetyltransferase [Chitinimonas prasina]|uniref:N-acetyltransferase n=1 Tax=Chitinimonas prasina TaxID=1434937 RepID=A0ABQ5YMJ0_9NEIS|nr:GNAT family N-acetyltransferase [Chitinimonas prasina]GLR15154.1 N-acetyltransferase [Chitinimonas prasina]
MLIRQLVPADLDLFRALRLAGLRECPAAFAASLEEEAELPPGQMSEWLQAGPHGWILGAFDGDVLVGVVGLGRERMRKLQHKAVVWGMYVAASHRRRGVALALLQSLKQQAAGMAGLRQLNLGVHTRNAPALALYAALGFTVYGTETHCMQVDGTWHDEYLMACTL